MEAAMNYDDGFHEPIETWEVIASLILVLVGICGLGGIAHFIYTVAKGVWL